MTKLKVCMLGAFAVGKTSLVRRYVHSVFDEKYQTTLGVKIDQKSLLLDDHKIELILWDLAGEDEFIKVRSSYLRGSSGAILVADGTRGETLNTAFELKDKLESEVGDVPLVLLINKSDLSEHWSIDAYQLELLRDSGWQIVETSARNNDNVEQAFESLARRMLMVTA